MIAKFFSLSISEFFLRGSKFLFFLSIANLYGESVIYEYGFFTALFSIIFVFSDLGYQTLITKEISISNSFRNYIKYSKLSIFRVLIFIFISSLFLAYYSFSDNILYVYIAVLFLADAVCAMNFSFYRALHKSKKESSTKFIIGCIFFIVSVVAFFKFDVQVLFFILSLSYLYYSFHNAKYLKPKLLKYFFKNFNLNEYLHHTKSSLYIFIGALFTIAYLRVDILMLDWLDSSYSVSIYTIASRILELSLIIPGMISVLLLPKLTKSININIKKDLFYQLVIGIFTLLIFLSCSSLLIELLFRDFSESDGILRILLLAIPFILLNSYIFTLFVSKNKSIYYMYVTLFMFFCNFILNYIYIPRYGYEAAAYTTIFTEFIGLLFSGLLLFFYRRNLKISLMS